VDSYDACYLPDGRIVFCGSACFQGVPCNFSDVAVLYRMDADGGNVRQLGFEQDHDFNPVVMDDGRVLYLRWEYADLPHAHSRRMFTMNPDGTAQTVYYGSNSYWPNGTFGRGRSPGSRAGSGGHRRRAPRLAPRRGTGAVRSCGRHEAHGPCSGFPVGAGPSSRWSATN
jgi:hypothetical protein